MFLVQSKPQKTFKETLQYCESGEQNVFRPQ